MTAQGLGHTSKAELAGRGHGQVSDSNCVWDSKATGTILKFKKIADF